MGNLKIIASSKNWIDSKAVEALQNIAKYKGVKSVVALPDLSVGLVPNGAAILSEDRIFPHLIGSDIGCGMSLFKTEAKPKKIKLEKFVKFLSKIETLNDIEIDMPELGYNLGTIGKGNHFAELHLVNEVQDKKLFKQLGLSKESLYLLIHSGSRAFGQIVFNRISGKYQPSEGLSESEANNYLKEHKKAIEYAKLSRQMIAKRLLKAIKLEPNIKCVSDTAHNSITKTANGWLHRKGATPTNKGAVIIAGSRGSLSYLVMPTNNTKKSNYSLAHGAGRKWERKMAFAKLKEQFSKESLSRSEIGTRVVCRDSKLLYEEAPKAYKNIDIVISDLVEANLATVIATFKPILTYKE